MSNLNNKIIEIWPPLYQTDSKFIKKKYKQVKKNPQHKFPTQILSRM